MTKLEILGLKKAAIVLKALADSMKSHSAKMEALVLVQLVVQAANELEEHNATKGTGVCL
jgi:hypothetical protein